MAGRFLIFRTPLDAQIETGIPIRYPVLLQEGRFAIVTNVGCGMRWTLVVRQTNASLKRTAKSCGPDAPMLASSLAGDPASHGGNKARLTRESAK
jgi:hypothetical protein